MGREGKIASGWPKSPRDYAAPNLKSPTAFNFGNGAPEGLRMRPCRIEKLTNCGSVTFGERGVRCKTAGAHGARWFLNPWVCPGVATSPDPKRNSRNVKIRGRGAKCPWDLGIMGLDPKFEEHGASSLGLAPDAVGPKFRKLQQC
jgi:hypothetical protein